MLGKSESRSEDRDQTSQQIVLSLDSLSYRTGSGTSHPVVKERALLSCRKAYRQSLTIAIQLLLVNSLISGCSAMEPALSAAEGACVPVLGLSFRAERRDAFAFRGRSPCHVAKSRNLSETWSGAGREINPIFFPVHLSLYIKR